MARGEGYTESMNGADKQLNKMDRLGDMLHFPAVVNAGATVNVLVTIAATWWVAARYPAWPFAWVLLVLALNLAPVVAMRLLRVHEGPYPTVAGMNFFRDQHRFSDWVYLAASANMTFWILAGWTLSLVAHRVGALVGLEVVAALLTFMPVLARGALKRT